MNNNSCLGLQTNTNANTNAEFNVSTNAAFTKPTMVHKLWPG